MDMRGGMGNWKKTRKGRNLSEYVNSWLTLEETEQSEPERVGSGSSSAEEAAVKETQEALERLVEQEKEEGGILDQFIESVAMMGKPSALLG